MRKKARVLVVDDDELLRMCLVDWLQKDGYRTDTAADGNEALAKLRATPYDMLLVDIVMPGMNGISLLEEVRKEDPDQPIVMMTAHGSIDSAVEAMKKGASDYLQKPFDPKQLRTRLEQVESRQRLLEENRRCRQHIQRIEASGEFLAGSAAMADVLDLIEDVGPTESTVLISGESGTGKEMVAREIHRRSLRADGPFVAVNFGALPESLAESELFGHEKGSFTGAIALKRGVLELSQGGTLFLDEIGDAALKIQIDLLRVLEEKKFRRIGGSSTVAMDARIVAATNRDLEEMILQGQFRRDLFYRLNVVRIHIPPLRDRKEDVALLAEKFLRHYSGEMKRSIAAFAPEAMNMLAAYDWPGNVRELRNAVERAVVVAKGTRIVPDDLPIRTDQTSGEPNGLKLDGMEKKHIEETLRVCGWNISRTAATLGIDRSTLYAKLKKYDLTKS